MSITGIVHTTEQASKSPQRVISLKLPLNAAKATGNVLIESVFVTINGHIKLFHVVTNVKIARGSFNVELKRGDYLIQSNRKITKTLYDVIIE